MKPSLVVFLLICCAYSCISDAGYITPPRESYSDLKTRVATEQSRFREAYAVADAAGRDSLLTAARDYLFGVITTDFFDQWYGTEWDFNGTTHTPREGKIACGYFITTVLSDAGFEIPRTFWAQQASEYYITRMTSDIKRFSNKPVQTVVAYFEGREDGLYVVGLDNHVGFVYRKNGKLRFVHASYYDPEKGVQSETLDGNNPLANSAYRVSGRILGDEMIRRWITGEKWEQ